MERSKESEEIDPVVDTLIVSPIIDGLVSAGINRVNIIIRMVQFQGRSLCEIKQTGEPGRRLLVGYLGGTVVSAFEGDQERGIAGVDGGIRWLQGLWIN